MKKTVTKRLVTIMMAFAVLFTTVFAGASEVKAEVKTKNVYESSDYEQAAAGTEVKIPFTLTSNNGMQVLIIVPTQVQVSLALYDSTGSLLDEYDNNPMTIKATEWYSYQSVYATVDAWDSGLPAGDYYYGLTFETDTQFMLDIEQVMNEAKISQTKATITQGFTQKLSVSGSKVKSWKSSSKKVAKVDKNGKVTAVKAGKATITAVLTDGSKKTCKVTVKANKYSDTKPTTSDVGYGRRVLSAYSASFDKSGNLVISTVFVNNSSYRVPYLENVKITVKDEKGKTVGVYKAKKINVGTSAYSTKNVKVTIKKSSLKKKKADLRNASISTSGVAVYYY